MAIRTRIAPVDRSVVVKLCPGIDPRERSHMLAEFARKALAEAQTASQRATGRVPSHDTFVDGREGADLASVKPDGVIVFRFALLREALLWIHQALVEKSPVLSGRYSRSHVLFADGVEVFPGAEEVPSAREYIFLNVQPYARKIERKGDRPGQSKKAPDGVYEAVAALAAQRFGRLASIKFSFRSFQGTAVVDYIPTGTKGHRNRLRNGRFTSTATAHRAARSRERATRQPCIVISTR